MKTAETPLFRLWKYLNIGYIIFWIMFLLGKGDKWFWFNWSHPIVPILGFGSIIAFLIIKYQKK